jgi:AAHS family 4-hydroxybenzoate transporter-like MFS transporter
MRSPRTVDLNAAIERIGVGRLAIFVIVMAFLMMMTDGYDFGTLAVAAPSILKEWRLSPKSMGIVFSVTFFGLMIGSLFYGWMSDRIGRRFTIIFGTFNFGIPILLTVFAVNIQELMVLRFIGGIGMGGVVPIAYTLVSEYAPKRMRSTVTVITNAGYTVGATFSGLVAAQTLTSFGWHPLFFIGGLFSLVLAVVLIALLPDSVLHIATTSPASPKLLPLARRLLPNENFDSSTRFVAHDPQEDHGVPGRAGFLQLFVGPRAWATILLWALFLFDSVSLFFLGSWLPYVMRETGASVATASLTHSLFTFAGLIGGLAIMRFLDRIGPIAVVVLPIVGGLSEIAMGWPGIGESTLLVAAVLAGLALGGVHHAVYAIAVRFYPPSVRGSGMSYATVWGRIGGIIAPTVGGYFRATHMPLQELMTLAAVPCVAVAVVSVLLGGLYRRSFDTPATALDPVPAGSSAAE